MSNVKPGDFAKIISHGPHNGHLVYVEREASADKFRPELAIFVILHGGVWWECTHLGTVMAMSQIDFKIHQKAPGSKTPIPDCMLRRVDPPAEDIELPSPSVPLEA